MENKILSICIPTYNRAELLKKNVLELIGLIRDKNIPLYISDNCSTDHTEAIVNELKLIYKYIYYFKQDKNIADENFAFVLKQPTTKYMWLLGDKHRINPKMFHKLFSILIHNDYDAIVVNDGKKRVKNIPTQIYRDGNSLLVDLGWHMTLISSLIFSKRTVSEIIFKRYKNSHFMHTAGIFESIAKHEFAVLWIADTLLQRPEKGSGVSWRKSIFEVFMDNWANSILSLPPKYSISSKLECIKKHGICSKIFSFRSFMSLRREGIFNIFVYRKYKNHFHYFTSVPVLIIFLISILPAKAIEAVRKLRDV